MQKIRKNDDRILRSRAANGGTKEEAEGRTNRAKLIGHFSQRGCPTSDLVPRCVDRRTDRPYFTGPDLSSYRRWYNYCGIYQNV